MPIPWRLPRLGCLLYVCWWDKKIIAISRGRSPISSLLPLTSSAAAAGLHPGGGCARSGAWLGAHRHRLLDAGTLQVRLLRGVQAPVLQHPGRGELLPVAHLPLPGRLRLGRVLRRHRAGAHGGCQGW